MIAYFDCFSGAAGYDIGRTGGCGRRSGKLKGEVAIALTGYDLRFERWNDRGSAALRLPWRWTRV